MRVLCNTYLFAKNECTIFKILYNASRRTFCPPAYFGHVTCGLLFLHASDHGAAVAGGFPRHHIVFVAIWATAEFCALSRIGADVDHNDVPAGWATKGYTRFHSPCCKGNSHHAEQCGKG